MNLVQITPGAGSMFCGGCLRDNALVKALREFGHATVMVPLYLPLTLDEENQSEGTPVFFGGINVYLQQKSAFFRKLPGWLHDWLASPRLLKLAAGSAAKTRAEDLGELTLSMIRGEEGNQVRELDQLITWLKTQPKTDAITLSNALLLGLARRLKSELNTPVVCTLQGEDTFLDALPEAQRAEAWRLLRERARDVNVFIAPSRYFGDLMRQRLHLPAEKVRVIYNGISLEGYPATPRTSAGAGGSVLGYFARMCREKGLETLVQAFIRLKRKPEHAGLRLKVGGSCGPTDQVLVDELRQRLRSEGILDDVEFFPNVDRHVKIELLQSLTVFSAPAMYGEAFGLYVIEALACGVPVVQPRHAAFPELIEATGGGVLYDPEDENALTSGLNELLLNPAKASNLGEAGRRAVREKFTVRRMAEEIVQLLHDLLERRDGLS